MTLRGHRTEIPSIGLVLNTHLFQVPRRYVPFVRSPNDVCPSVRPGSSIGQAVLIQGLPAPRCLRFQLRVEPVHFSSKTDRTIPLVPKVVAGEADRSVASSRRR